MHNVKVESYVITNDGDILCLPMWQVIFYFSVPPLGQKFDHCLGDIS